MNRLQAEFLKLPKSQRYLVFGIGYVLIFFLLYTSLIAGTWDGINAAEAAQRDLKGKLDTVSVRARNLPAFEEKFNRLKEALKIALRELPNTSEIPGLLSEIDGLARRSGLEVRKFQPLPEVMHEYYAEVPVQLAMDGSYHQVGVFFDRVSKMSRIVSVKDVEVGEPKDAGTEVSLTVRGKAVTFRFLSDAEIEANKGKEGQPGGGQ